MSRRNRPPRTDHEEIHAREILASSGVDTSDRAAVISEGKQVCAELEAGKTLYELIEVQSVDPDRLATVVTAATITFCPAVTQDLLPSGVPDLSDLPTVPNISDFPELPDLTDLPGN